MKIIYMGTPELALPCLEAIHHSTQHQVLAVVTQPDRPKGRGRKLVSSPVKIKAQEFKLPVLQPEDLKDPVFCQQIKELQADILVVVAFSILPDALLKVCPHGAINLHASLLPKFRGAAPIQWAIARGEKESGVTLFQLDPKMDHGVILTQKTLAIGENETSGEFGPRLLDMGKEAMLETLNQIESGTTHPLEQNHHQASFARKLKKEDGKINWTRTAQEIHNQVRAFNPYPMGFSTLSFNQKKIRIRKTEKTNIVAQTPGRMTLENGEPVVDCGDFQLRLLELQPEGKPPMSGKDFINGLQTKTNLSFE